MKKNLLLILIFSIFVGFSNTAKSQTTLAPGDLMIVTVNADGTDNFDFIPLVDLTAGTVIKFTDNAWVTANSALNTNEGTLTYTSSAPVAKGAIVSYPGALGGEWTATTNIAVSASGDNLLVYQGDVATPSFIYGIGWAIAAPWPYATNTNTSDIPGALSVLNNTIVTLGINDNYQYQTANGTTGTAAELLALVANPAYWLGNDATAYAALTGSFTVNSGTVTPTIAITTNSPVVAGDIIQGAQDQILATFEAAVTVADATLNAVNFNAAATAISTDFSNLELWYSADSDFANATSISSFVPTVGGALSFTGFTQPITNGSTGYFFITADVNSGAVVTNTITITGIVPVFALGSPTGTVVDGGAQTIVAAISNDTCSNASVITAGTIHNIHTIDGATDSYDQWFSYTPTFDGTITISNCTSDVDGYLIVYEATCGGTVIVQSDNDICGSVNNLSENETITVTNGTTYLIGWGNWDFSTSPEFDWTLTETPVVSSYTMKFNVDLADAIAKGLFVEGTDAIQVAGDFNAWTGVTLIKVGATSIYSYTTGSDFAVDDVIEFKFVVNGSEWQPTSNISYTIIEGVNVYDYMWVTPEIGWLNLQYPTSGTITLGDDYAVYGRVWIDGITGSGAVDALTAFVGYSSTNTDPSTWTNWYTATYNSTCGDCGNNNEYSANLGTNITTAGSYYYATKYVYGNDAPVYGGLTGEWVSGQSGTLTVNPVVPTQIAITNVTPASPYVNQTFSVTVQSQDAGGNPTNVIANELITLTDASTNGVLSGTLSGTITAGTNSVTFTGLSYNYVETVSIQAQSTNYGNDEMLVTIQDVPSIPAVFFSEYIECNGGNDKALEIYNGTGAVLDLTGYTVKIASNGGAWSATPFVLVDSLATLAAGDVYVISNASATDVNIVTASDATSSVTFYNGDDAVGLFYNNVLIDVIGVQGVDPGTGWDVAGVVTGTLNHTLLRKYPDVTTGNTDWIASAGTTTENSEWEVLAENIFTNIGWHGTSTTTPEIANISINPTSPTPTDAVTVSADITDDGTISSATINWGTTTGNLSNSVVMTAAKGLYTGIIPALTTEGTIYYTVSATDDGANTTVSDEMNYAVSIPTTPTQLFISDVTPNTPVIDLPFSLTVDVLDVNGDPANVTEDTQITLVCTSGAILSGTLIGTILNGQGSVTFADLTLNMLGDNTIRATTTSGMVLTFDEIIVPIQDQPVASNLFISEYIEGTASNKALEIFNGTAGVVSLDNYRIAYASGGGNWSVWHTFPAASTIAAGDVWVVAADAANATILAEADEALAYPSVAHFNGDDAIALEFTSDGGTTWTIIDIIGNPTVDPGTAWDVAGVTGATAEHTLVRKYPQVTEGNTDWLLSAGTDVNTSEWVVYAQDDFTFIGWHGIISTDPAVNITYPSDGGTVPSTDINATFTVQNFVIGTDGYIEYTYDGGTTILDHNTTDPIAITGLTDGNVYTLTLELVDMSGNSLTIPAIDEATFTVDVPVTNEVATIAELRLGTADNTTLYTLTGDAVITYLRTSRNQKYIQDATAGILIDDNAGIITTVYNQYDVISGGITGTLTLYNGLLEFIPTINTAPSTVNTPVTPEIVTIPDLATIESYEAELIKLENVSFDAPTGNFAAGQNYTITDGTNTIVFRTSFSEADYIGQPVYTMPFSVTALVIEYNGTVQVVARNIADFEFGTDPYITITSPANNATLTVNDVEVEFTVGNFELGVDGKVEYSIDGGTTVEYATASPISFIDLVDAFYTVDLQLVDMDNLPLATPVTASVTFEVDAVISVEELNTECVVYPNPASAVLTISANTTINNIIIFDIVGKSVYSASQNSENVKVDISTFDSGIYMINISTENGNIIEKFIKN